ncbi:hypothetical protein DICVIV_10050 [Dictyocaulus viviparus]|uniref:Uncharacterized protein n=1 Tax=Dictyocaulus viviparus TaxID=29172 RepID=A0A0D8XJB7_DICVI|nr:hypothetical protein DICVIV_10050 [Dictyocaulus viviparus]
MDGAADLLALLPEVQEALSDEFDAIECSIGPGPDLSQSPFRLNISHLGREITYVPDITNLNGFNDNGLQRINLSKNSALYTDGHRSCCLEVILGQGRNWQNALTKLFDRIYPNKWAFFIVELEQNRCSNENEKNARKSTVQPLRLVISMFALQNQPSYHLLCCNAPLISARKEDTPDSTEQSSLLSSPPESLAETSKLSLWIVPVTKMFAVPPPVPPKKVKVVKKVVKKQAPNNEMKHEENGEKKKSLKVVRKKLEKDDTSPSEPNGVHINGCDASTGGTISMSYSSDILENTTNIKPPSNEVEHMEREVISAEDSGDSALSDLRKKLLLSESTSGANIEWRSSTSPSRLLFTRTGTTPERRLDPIYEGNHCVEQSISLDQLSQQQSVSKLNGTHCEFPPICLQLILSKYFSYEELSKLRGVHPYWDEICGQMLNAAYYKMLERSDKLLMMLQRKLPANPDLHFPTTTLTNIQVHILNPIDIMRAVLDEGELRLLFWLNITKLFSSYIFKNTVNWEPVSLLAKKASIHYRTHLERIMEERLGEGLRLKAAQRILRLDSFLVESTVTKLERDTNKARDELRWELDQLKQQNAQLRKDNRQLKADHMRLETRVELLEQKFKTLARLLS